MHYATGLEKVQVWNLRTGTTQVVPLVVPTHVVFPNKEAALTYAEQVAPHGVNRQQGPRSAQTPNRGCALIEEEQRERAAAYGQSHLQ